MLGVCYQIYIAESVLLKQSLGRATRYDDFAFPICTTMFRTISLALLLGLAGTACTNNPNDTRQQATNATEQLKRDSREAAGEIKKGTAQARTQLTAAAQGVKEGLNDKSSSQVDLNSADQAQLMGLQGIDEARANAIIANRPYQRSHDVVRKGAISEAQYQKIAGNLTVGASNK